MSNKIGILISTPCPRQRGIFIQTLFTLLLTFTTLLIHAQQEIPLYSQVPNSRNAKNQEEVVNNPEVDTLVYKVSVPTLTVFLPAKGATGSAVIICPGGGYHVLLMNREGRNIARAFNQRGVAAFVLKYRLPDEGVMVDKSIGPLQDAQRAIQLLREHAGEWHIDPHKIGIMGFSAGGHLAATAGTHFENPLIENAKGLSLRPDFMILIYPVISFTDSIGHIGSRENLLGKFATADQIRFFSNEKQVSKSTPPAFITLAGDDSVVPIANSLSFYDQLRKFSVPVELHVYSSGEHGFLKEPPFEEWFGRCCYWMKSNGWL